MNPIVLVTGGSRGIGAATSKYLAKQHYSVCVIFHSYDFVAKMVVEVLKSSGVIAIGVHSDVSVL
jgi:NAD(P)-dependent dehydrogenase (short-subunit alcohol dehydrogenase family)